jgi:peptidoglycan/LPS O-acetylase OafA/YrhL
MNSPEPRSSAGTTIIPATVDPLKVDEQGVARTNRLPSLTGLRFLAAFMVFIYHSSLQTPYLRLFGDKSFSDTYFTLAQPTGGLGVTFFFVLSGFILTWSAREQDTRGWFWRRRFFKIYPNHVVTWALTMALFAWAVTPTWKALLNLFLLQAWVPDFMTHFSVDQPSWSLGTEALFYLCFPLLLVLCKRIRADRLTFWIVGTVAGIVLTPLICYLAFSGSPSISIGAASELQYYFAYIFPPARLLDFLLGILVARAVRTGRWRDVGMVWSGVLLVAGFALAEFVPYLYGLRVTCVVPVAMLIAAVATADINGRWTPFANRTMVWLGNISFAFYLLHFIVLRCTRILLGDQFFPTSVSFLVLIADVTITIVLSSALFAWFERPIVRAQAKLE